MSGRLRVNLSFSGPVVLEKKILKWLHPIFACLWLSPVWRRLDLLFEQFVLCRGGLYHIWTISNMHYARKCIWAFMALWFLRKKLNDQIPLLHFCDYLPLKRTWPFIWMISNSFYLMVICTKFDWNWHAGSMEKYSF
jgi:hypothetical protein